MRMPAITPGQRWLPAMMNSREMCVTQDRRGHFRALIVDENGDIVAEARGRTAQEAEANAKAIAAVPAMLEELVETREAILAAAKDTLWCSDANPAETVVDHIDAALRLAGATP